MRQYKIELSIIVVLLFFWEAEFFILDILPYLKSDTQTVFAQNDTSPGLGQTTPSTNSEPLKVVINEIAWMGTVGNQYGEWIELYNTGTEEIDLNNWKLYKDGGGVLVFTLTKKITSKGYLVIERTTNSSPDPLPEINDEFGKFGGGSLINLPGGEHLVLKNAEGDPVEDLNFSSGWPAGNNTTNKQTMERKNSLLPGDDPLNWQNSEYPGGTPKAENSKEEELNPPPEEPSTPPENPNQDTAPAVNFILINELLPDPVGDDHEGEFIELFNNGDTTADLSSWELKDETKKEKSQSGFVIEADTTMPAFSYLTFYTGKKISLNNDGDTVYLYDPGQALKDQRVYTGKIPEGESYNRQDDNTWAWSTTTTPGLQNIITTKDDSANAITNKSYPRHIWINEFLPNPKGKDAENEFIEIYNPGPAEIDLTNWQIDDQEDKGSHPYTFPENFIIKRGEYITLPYSQTKISLNNNDDWVRLLWPDGQAIDEVPYFDPPEGESYNKTNNGWSWSCTATPGEPNKIVSDDECAASPEEETKNYSRALWINEFLPDPKGKDEEGEFIELQNRGEEEIDLTAWQVDDCESAGSKPHTFPENTKIKADSYLVLYYEETKISLNNNGDCVRLLNPAGQAVDEIKYGKAKEGQSYSRQNVDHWQWTDNPTPGKDNEFPQILAAKNSITKNNQPPATTPKRQTLPQTGPNIYFYFSPIFLFFFLFSLTKIKKYYKNRSCSFIKSV